MVLFLIRIRALASSLASPASSTSRTAPSTCSRPTSPTRWRPALPLGAASSTWRWRWRARRGRARHAGGGGLLRRVYRAPELYQLLLTFALVLVVSDVRQAGLGQREQDGPKRARARRRRPHRGAARAHVRSRASCRSAHRGRGALVALLSHALGRAHPRGHAGSARWWRCSASIRRASSPACSRLAAGWPAWPAPCSSTTGAHHRHGRGHHHGGLRVVVWAAWLRAGRAAGRHRHRRHPTPSACSCCRGPRRAHVRGDGGRLLVVRPWGTARAPRGPGAVAWRIVLGGVVAVAPAGSSPPSSRPWWRCRPLLPTFYVWVLVEILAFALFAASLHLLMGTGAIGLVRPRGRLRPRRLWCGRCSCSGEGADASSPSQAARWRPPLAAVVIGFFLRAGSRRSTSRCSRWPQPRSPTRFVHQWYDVTGGDNGLLGIWPAPWLASPIRYYYLALAACGAGLGALAAADRAPFGPRCGRRATTRGARRRSGSTCARTSGWPSSSRGSSVGSPAAPSRSSRAACSPSCWRCRSR